MIKLTFMLQAITPKTSGMKKRGCRAKVWKVTITIRIEIQTATR